MDIYKGFRTLLAVAAFAVPMTALPAAKAQVAVVGVPVAVAPPDLPVYVQPDIPGDGYLWTPGYWAWGDAGYYWVPGVWVQPPAVGLLWTPGYWGWDTDAYYWHEGYWGPEVGFYGGINYGYGYFGHGFEGGYWNGGAFYYNQASGDYGGHVAHVYNRAVSGGGGTTVAFNGGAGGIQITASAQETAAAGQRRSGATTGQTQTRQSASQDRSQLASVNQGHPGTTAAANSNSYRATAQQHAMSTPISAQDRASGKSFNPGANRSPYGAQGGTRPGMGNASTAPRGNYPQQQGMQQHPMPGPGAQQRPVNPQMQQHPPVQQNHPPVQQHPAPKVPVYQHHQ